MQLGLSIRPISGLRKLRTSCSDLGSLQSNLNDGFSFSCERWASGSINVLLLLRQKHAVTMQWELTRWGCDAGFTRRQRRPVRHRRSGASVCRPPLRHAANQWRNARLTRRRRCLPIGRCEVRGLHDHIASLSMTASTADSDITFCWSHSLYTALLNIAVSMS